MYIREEHIKSMDMTLAGEPSELGSSGYLLGPGGHSQGFLEGRAGKAMHMVLLGVAVQEMGKRGQEMGKRGQGGRRSHQFKLSHVLA